MTASGECVYGVVGRSRDDATVQKSAELHPARTAYVEGTADAKEASDHHAPPQQSEFHPVIVADQQASGGLKHRGRVIPDLLQHLAQSHSIE